jgi:polyphosphate kinase
MPRNLDRRVEVLFPVEDPATRAAIVSAILPVQLDDTVKVRIMNPDGTYSRAIPAEAPEPVNAQSWLVEHRGSWHDAVP